MRLYSNSPCVIVLTEMDVKVRVNKHPPVVLPKGHMMMLHNCNNEIDFSYFKESHVVSISQTVLRDYLAFLKKDLSGINPWPRQSFPGVYCQSKMPAIVQLAATRSTFITNDASDIARTRSLLFAVLSAFLVQKAFIPFLMHMLRSSIKDSVCHIIQSNINRQWKLNVVARELYISPGLLKKKLKNENTTYTKIVSECRMYYALQQLLTTDKNISQVSELCGYRSTSYFITVFKSFYGVTPLSYISQYRH